MFMISLIGLLSANSHKGYITQFCNYAISPQSETQGGTQSPTTGYCPYNIRGSTQPYKKLLSNILRCPLFHPLEVHVLF